MKQRLTHLDLFSGIGGFALAARWAGFETIAFCEIEPYAQQVLIEKFGAIMAHSKSARFQGHNEQQSKSARASARCHTELHSDIFKLNGTDYAGVTLLTGGFPCQPFSVAGKRRGKEDDRHLWPQMLRVIQEARPAWVLGENVAGIINMELDAVLSDLENIGYSCWPLVIPACAVDARHRRDRVWILASDSRRNECAKSISQHERTEISSGSGCDRLDSRYDVADSGCERQLQRCTTKPIQSQNNTTELCCSWKQEDTWFAESGMGRVAHGIPNRAHRLRALGNAIVPQVAYQIIKGIADIEGLT